MKTLALKIDVTKIDKNRLYKGAKGTYLDAIVMLNDEPDQYGNIGMIVQSVSKEERLAKVRGNILGNAKEIGGGQGGSRPQTSGRPARRQETPPAGDATAKPPEDDSDLPF